MRRPNGYVIYRDGWRVVIATGFSRASENRKTGNMIQIWILSSKEHPVVHQGKHNCYDCPIKNECYVITGKAPASVYRAYRAGSYPDLPSFDLFAGRMVRFGAYGDPFAIPLGKLRSIADASDGWTGYTHQWRRPEARGYRGYLMASCETAAQAREAQATGWRTFRIGEQSVNDTLCLNHKGIQCADCGLCSGVQGKGTQSVFIPAHGNGAKQLQAKGVE